MDEYIELIDKYRITQSEETDYNPPSYVWVDNTGKIVRCEYCAKADFAGMSRGMVYCMEFGRTMLETDYCSRGYTVEQEG